MTHTYTILIAEDDPYLREAYTRRFARTSVSVRTASNGEEAIRMMAERQPDLLICDIMMPEKDGWWVIDHFPPEKRSFPVIMLTNLEDSQTRQLCTDKKVDGYFVKKDMSLASLVQMAERLLKERSSPSGA